MIKQEEIYQALELIGNVIDGMNKVQHQHNKMLLDLYERVAKLEEAQCLKNI